MNKKLIKENIVNALRGETEIDKIVIFGSFVNVAEPEDVDIAVFQNSKQDYLSLAVKYRKLTRNVSKIIPLDIIPLRNSTTDHFVESEVNKGEVIYERGNRYMA